MAIVGDLINEPADADRARSAVARLEQLFAAAPATTQDRFRPAYQAILDRWNEWDESLIFYTWREAKIIGMDADRLATEIASATGRASGADPNLGRSTVGDLISAAVALGAIGLVTVLILKYR